MIVEDEQTGPDTDENSVEQKWKRLRDSIKHGLNVLPKKQKQKNKDWMTDDILKMMEHRKELKNSNPAQYRRQNKLIKRMHKSKEILAV